MKKIMSKNLTQKIIIAIVMVLSFNFVAPNFSKADAFGTLGGPIIDFVASLGDAVMALLEVFMNGKTVDLLSEKGFMVDHDKFDGNQADYGMEVDSNKSLQKINIDADDLDQGWFGRKSYTIPVIKYGPELIFENKVPALDANFINPTDWGDDTQNDKSIAKQLQSTISSWYNALRNLVIVGLLSILVYVGIRMMITSVASDKAKYKQMFMDWLIALCLVFFLHYIMNFTMTVTQMITDGLSGASDVEIVVTDGDDTLEFVTNLTGACRMQVQYADLMKRMIYLIFYIALIVYTVKFTFVYVKRAITMAFLTLMAPLVTLTYPIDKMGDGKAQAFNMWLKEFAFNAILQPFHLIVYSIFLGSAMNIATNNPIYAILVLAFIGPAEKLLRKFFNFDKMQSSGNSFVGGFGGAAAFNTVRGVISRGAQRLGGGNSGKSSGSKPIRQQASLDKPIKSDDAPSGYGAFATASANVNADDNSNNENANNDNNNLRANNNPQNDENAALDRYRQEGFGQNANGAYYNPYTDEYDSGYNPARDSSYNSQLGNQQPDPMGENNNPGLLRRGLNAVGNTGAGRYIKGAVGGIGRYTSEGFKKKFGSLSATRDTLGSAAKFAGKTAIRATTTGVGAAVGLGMGIAGDDLEDVFKYGAAGTALGATALNNMVLGAGSTIGSAVANSGVVQAASQGGKEAYYGSVNAADIAAQDRQLKESGEIRQSISNEITKSDGTRLDSNTLNDYEDRGISHYDAGITNLGDINKTLKLEDSIRSDLAENTQMDEESRNQTAKLQAQTIAKIAGDVNGDKLATDAKYRNGRRDDFKAGLLKANPSMSKSELDANSEQMMKLLCKYKKVNYIKD